MTSLTTDEGIRALVAELDSAGNLPAEFGPLLHASPREQFVPDQIWVNREPINRAADPTRWLEVVYSNEAIVTQFDDGKTVWPEAGNRPTCSTSQPSAVLGMLDALRVEPGNSVLEIGTGTGWNAALLSEMVGQSGGVTTIEIDLNLADSARERVTLAGYDGIYTVQGDATFGVRESAPFDRVIATMAVPLGRIPYAWFEQTKPGGMILTPVRADLAAGPLVRFVVNDDGTANGRTMEMGVGFMESRSQRTARTPDNDIDWEQDGTDKSITEIRPWPMFEVPSPRWALAVAMPSVRCDVESNTEERPYRVAWLRDPVSDSWASVVPVEVDSGRYLVRQSGPRRLWDEAERVYRWWQARGEPFITKWEWTITPDRQTIHLPA